MQKLEGGAPTQNSEHTVSRAGVMSYADVTFVNPLCVES